MVIIFKDLFKSNPFVYDTKVSQVTSSAFFAWLFYKASHKTYDFSFSNEKKYQDISFMWSLIFFCEYRRFRVKVIFSGMTTSRYSCLSLPFAIIYICTLNVNSLKDWFDWLDHWIFLNTIFLVKLLSIGILHAHILRTDSIIYA